MSIKLLDQQATVATGAWVKNEKPHVFAWAVVEGTGALTAEVKLEMSQTDPAGSMGQSQSGSRSVGLSGVGPSFCTTLMSSVDKVYDGRFVRASVMAISGTNAKVTIHLADE